MMHWNVTIYVVENFWEVLLRNLDKKYDTSFPSEAIQEVCSEIHLISLVITQLNHTSKSFAL